jgi:hypothetical protein
VDSKQFDAVAKALVSGAHRRDALRALVGGALGIAGLWEVEAAKTGNCSPACAECNTCKVGKCKKKRGKKKCKAGVCEPNENGSACQNNPCKECQGGKCVNKAGNSACTTGGTDGLCTANGTCNTKPGCSIPVQGACNQGTAVCCGGQAACTAIGLPPAGKCLTPGASGSPCLAPSDCVSGSCLGFVCQ